VWWLMPQLLRKQRQEECPWVKIVGDPVSKTIFFFLRLGLALVVQACNPSYLRGWDQEDLFEANLSKKLVRPPCQPVLNVMAHTCHPSYMGGWDEQDCGSKPAWPKKFARAYLNGKKVAGGGAHLLSQQQGEA
jgi:hypothetical protein